MGLPAFLGAELVVFSGSVQQRFNEFAHYPVAYAAAVTCPALLAGDRDRRVTPAKAAGIYDRMRGPKQLVRFPEAGHALLRYTSRDVCGRPSPKLSFVLCWSAARRTLMGSHNALT